jgi:L-iditol 2-dehydrogenase
MRAALALISTGQVDPAPLVSHRLPLEDTGRGLELQRRGEALKVVVEP